MSNQKPEAEVLLDKQLEFSSKTKKANVITSVSFAAVILITAVLFWILPDSEYSGEEKRALKQMPEISVSRFIKDFKTELDEIFMTDEEKQALEKSESLSDEISEYYADQFPARNALRALKGYTEMLLCKGQSNGIVMSDGMLIDPDTVTGSTTDENGNKTDRTTDDAKNTVTKNVSFIAYLDKMLKDTGVSLHTALAGRTTDVYENSLPCLFPKEDNRSLWQTYNDSVGKAGINSIDLLTPLRSHAESGEYVYYKTDHHWTTLGAYYAYVEIMKSLGDEPLPIESFTKEVASESFLGTVYAKSGVSPGGKDTVTFFRFEGDEDFTTTIPVGDDITEYKGFYNRVYLDSADKYSAFIGHDNFEYGGNNPITYVKKDGEENRQTLVLIKDSFAHSVVPFLAYHYDLIILDMRYYTPDGSTNKTVLQYANDENVSKILILYNMETFMNDSYLMRIIG